MVYRPLLCPLALALGLALASIAPPASAAGQSGALAGDGPYLHTDRGVLRTASGQRVRLSGVSWLGLETCVFAPSGLNVCPWWDLLDQVRALGFNVLRLPFSDKLLDPGSMPLSINYQLNPDLAGLSGLQVMDRIVHGAGQRGLRVVLDRHRPGCGAQSGLWYTPRYPERRWIADLVKLARRYRAEPAVIGIDLHNEPHDPATWGDGNPATDWRLAAERAGNAVLAANPHLLIIVEGVATYAGDTYWWGGNLAGAARAPVRLAVPHRLVYETHDFGPGVYWQPWFSSPRFPHNLPALWYAHWAYLLDRGDAPVLLGEFGGRNVAMGTPRTKARSLPQVEGVWQGTLLRYLAHHPGLNFMYWTLTPDSGDTGGLLNGDWQTVNITKEALLAALQGPPMPPPDALPAPAPLRVLAAATLLPDGRQQALMLQIVNDSAHPLNLRGADLRYWLQMPPSACSARAGARLPSPVGGRWAVAVDWASVNRWTVLSGRGSATGAAYIALRVVSRRAGAPVLPAYGGTLRIKLRLWRAAGAPAARTGNWSDPASMTPVPAPHVTLTAGGRRIWGESPLAYLERSEPGRCATTDGQRRPS